MTPAEAVQQVMETENIRVADIATRTELSPTTLAKIVDGSDRVQLRSLKECMKRLGFELQITVAPVGAN